ncbi:YoaK family protein [Nakamurella antarctica]|uniref:YoaK family protein n=1 Tax=Nakamurella antarctica TaxID=1902245 RepID=UPI0013DE1901|nr:YoaK family protein [Nakamurella antarctica]
MRRNLRHNRPVLVLLAITSGAVDAIAFLGLGGIFTANMTGNLVLLGLVGRPDYQRSAIHAAAACAAFALGLYLSFRNGRPQPGKPEPGPYPLLVLVALMQSAIWVTWMLESATPNEMTQTIILITSAISMGVQTAASRRIAGHSGITTTFVTGTLTSLIEDAANSRHHATVARIFVIGALSMGALLCSLLLAYAPMFAPALPVLGVVAAIAVSLQRGSAAAELPSEQK